MEQWHAGRRVIFLWRNSKLVDLRRKDRPADGIYRVP